ncbi:hypothetical protein [Pleionea sp. CnH1-48]|nr:hypothetical protein [Pleionea sp. CnH1-48]
MQISRAADFSLIITIAPAEQKIGIGSGTPTKDKQPLSIGV